MVKFLKADELEPSLSKFQYFNKKS